jgi:gamma-glutamylcyclotransferase (GGCT)/AIG2-like uncharacterized protein YtfP
MHLFAYGTLLVPEIWLAVTGRECESVEAMLPGYTIRRVRGGDFPGILRSDDASVTGRVFLDLDAETVARLDRYEDSFYERIEVAPRNPRGQALTAQAYVVPDRHADVLSDEAWTLGWFREHALHDYLARLPGQDR